MKKKKKSKFQQRLEEMQLKHNVETGDSGPGNVNPHNEKTHPGDPGDGESQFAQEPWDPNIHGNRGWYCTRFQEPPYYAPVDIWVGQDVLEDWYRVSDGENDYYCNQRDNTIIHDPSHWHKRIGVIYPKYDPMTTDDVPKYTQRQVNEIIGEIDSILSTPPFGVRTQRQDELIEQFHVGLKEAKNIILNRMTGI